MDLDAAPRLLTLALGAAGIAVLHTFAPDHWMPFAVLARSERWTRGRLARVTLVAGLLHLGATVALGLLGVWLGWALDAIQWFQGARGTLSLAAMMVFGLLYAVWGLWRARGWAQAHAHADGSVHAHPLGRLHHAHPRASAAPRSGASAWTLFLVFVLGPCEALVPLMFAGLPLGAQGVLTAAGAFSCATLATMVALALLGEAGLRWARAPRLERYAHTLTGGAICATAALVLLTGI